MKKSLTILAATILSTSIAYAYPPKPEACPSVASLQSVTIDKFYKDSNGDGSWGGIVLNNKFNTKEDWMLFVGPLSTVDENDARQNAAAVLSTLHETVGPEKFEWTEGWVCGYEGTNNTIAVTITPVLDLPDLPLKAIKMGLKK